MRLKSINNHMDTCNDCGFTALFMYKDAANYPLCPKCNALDIKNFNALMSDMNDILDNEELESELESIENEEVLELNF